jgi:hypothetical protein
MPPGGEFMNRILGIVFSILIIVSLNAQGAIDGRWESTLTNGKPIARTDLTTFNFKVAGQVLSGNVEVGGAKFDIESGKVAKNTISFAWTTMFPPDGNPVTRTARGTIKGDQIDLAVDVLIESTRATSKETMVLKRVKN